MLDAAGWGYIQNSSSLFRCEFRVLMRTIFLDLHRCVESQPEDNSTRRSYLKLKGRVAVITGGSGGIGREIATVFLREGARVVITARGSVSLSGIEGLAERYPGYLHFIKTDVSSPGRVRHLMDKMASEFMTLDILVNAAAVQAPISPLAEVDDEEWIDNIRINLVGTFLCSKYALPLMMKMRYGRIINFSGGGATSPRPNFSAYACSKAAVVRLTETLAEEVKDYGICVNSIAPGAVNTQMCDEIIEAGHKAGNVELAAARNRKKEGGVSPSYAAELALFLASEKSGAITGRLISANRDNWRDEASELAGKSSLYTLRRIDKRNFKEVDK